jgi:hypothetical protein
MKPQSHKKKKKKQQSLLSKQWVPEVQNQYYGTEIKVPARPHSLWRLSGKIFSMPLPVPGDYLHSSAWGYIINCSL